MWFEVLIYFHPQFSIVKQIFQNLSILTYDPVLFTEISNPSRSVTHRAEVFLSDGTKIRMTLNFQFTLILFHGLDVEEESQDYL